jgi:ATP-binding cassette subfamily B protein
MVAMSLIAVVIASVLTAVLPMIIGTSIDGLLKHHGRPALGLVRLLAPVAGITLLAQLATVVRKQLAEYVATSFERDLRVDVYSALLHSPIDRDATKRLGALYGNANRSIEGTVKLLKLTFLDVLPTASLAVFAVIVAFVKNVHVGIAIFMVLPTSLAVVVAQVRNQKGVRIRVRDHKDDIDGRVYELLPAIDTIRSFAAESYFMRQVQDACDRLRLTEFVHHRAMSLFDAAKALNEGVWLIIVLIVATTASGADVTAGSLATFALLYLGILAPLRELHRVIDELSESSVQAFDMARILQREPDAAYRGVNHERASGEVDHRNGDVVVCDSVSLTYPGASNPVLDDISFAVPRGSSLGIVGRAGCGKSTLLSLLVRLRHGYEGSIRVDGHEVTELTSADLAHRIMYVSQLPSIFYGTVSENIAFGRPLSEKDIEDAAKAAAIDDDIRDMEHGYEQVLGERGQTISGGQKQKICLARALALKPQVLLLDEPTAQLDTVSEASVQAAIDRIGGVTKIVIAHRLSTLQSVDRIIVMDDGQIVQTGTFADLSRVDGPFKLLLDAQQLRA